MDNITKAVWKYIDTDPVVRESLKRNILNKRAVAFDFIKQTKSPESVNAVISAIRRYETEENRSEVLKKALDVIGNATISSKNGIVSFTLTKDLSTERMLPSLFSAIDVEKRERLRIIQADESVKVVFDKRNLSKVKELINIKNIIRIDDDLAEVNLHLDERTWSTPGITAVLTNELSLHGINIVEIMSCMPEIIIFFKEKDLMRAYTVLYDASKRKI